MPMFGNALIPPMLGDLQDVAASPARAGSGSAAWVTQSAPNTLVSNWARASASLISSTMPNWP